MRISRGELVAALVALAVGVPLVVVFVGAVATGQAHYRQAPLRALLGREPFEQLQSGKQTPLHYMCDPRAGGGECQERLAPDFTLPDRQGQPWRLSDHRGKVIVLNFWSITCPPCVEEMPSLEELATIMAFEGNRDVEVVAVSTDAGWAEVSALFPANPNLRILFDPDQSTVRERFGTHMFPETWIIDPEGIIRLRVDGKQDWASPLAIEIIRSYL